MVKKVSRLTSFFFSVFLAGLTSSTSALASSQTYSQRVTIQVPSYLFIDSDQRELNLSFLGQQSGAETNTQTVVYTIRGNGMMQSEGAPAVIASLDDDFPNMDLKVKVGSYTKEGGNTELSAVASDFISVGPSETPLAKKGISAGDGKLLRGQIAMTYKAVATSTLSSGEYSRQLIVTLTDI